MRPMSLVLPLLPLALLAFKPRSDGESGNVWPEVELVSTGRDKSSSTMGEK
jgi:hypothetical protein